MSKNVIFYPSSSKTPNVICLILAGGLGARLFPLTQHRCKPMTPFGGRFSILDIPLSNALRAGIQRTFVLTQYRTGALSSHIMQHYKPDSCSSFIHVLGPEQREQEEVVHFGGTADAVRKNMEYFLEYPVDYFLVLSGDQLYNFDLQAMTCFADDSGADVTVGVLPVTKKEASRMGVLKVGKESTITDFYEKPKDPVLLSRFCNSKRALRDMGLPEKNKRHYLASMGIYVFRKEALITLLHEDLRADFGQHLIPTAVKTKKVKAYLHSGYWEDIGTIDSFYRANMDLTSSEPALDCYHPANQIFVADPQNLPGAKIMGTRVNSCFFSEGSIIEAKEVSHSIFGMRSVVGTDTVIKGTYIMGNDFYHFTCPKSKHLVGPKIGEGCRIEKAIIDKNVFIGDGVRLVNRRGIKHYDGPWVYIRDGIIVVPKGAVIPDGFVLDPVESVR